ncbi:hypothetical protein P3T73_10145 [Kiritimatiellota bacterium B12222]|nr:hypothetical protein P3T73_10145 [Kiritimatiellota bacterium B12222]
MDTLPPLPSDNPQPPPLEEAPPEESSITPDLPHAHVEFPCENCGARMDFSPSSQKVTCPYCQHEMDIPQNEDEIEELDFHAYVTQTLKAEDTVDALTVTCATCHAETTLEENVTATNCPFCGSAIVTDPGHRRVIRPRSLLPFRVEDKEAMGLFREWIGKLWFAPTKVKQYARTHKGNLSGVYVPYWTYDANTISHYTGKRGDDYYVTEHYTTTENGRSVSRTRQVRKTRWRNVSGNVFRSFDDVLVLASHSLPDKHIQKLEPWDLNALVPYDQNYLAGFRAEAYQVDLESGFTEAKNIMEPEIRQEVKRDIGGDHQRISSLTTQYKQPTFKHILLPVWISAYSFKGTTYRFLVNARTGEVQGERPYSAIKITFAVIAGLLLAAIIAYVVYKNQG